MRNFTRRSVLGAAVGTLVAAPVKKRVIVVGAGLAGLSAAYELSESGHDVFLLEASDRPGGRVHTLREPFSDGLYAEAGAEGIYPTDPDYALRYIRKFNLPTVPYGSSGSSIFYFNNNPVRRSRAFETRIGLPLTAEERNLGVAGLRRKLFLPVVEQVNSGKDLQKLDQISYLELIRQMGGSPAAADLLRTTELGFAGPELNEYSALDVFGQIACFYSFKSPVYAIEGGNDRLPKALAAHLGARVHFKSPVRGIQQDAKQAHVIFEESGHRRTMAADYVICALPCTLLQRIEIKPALSNVKQQALQHVQYANVAVLFVQTRSKFWIADGLSGTVSTDLPFNYLWETTRVQKTAKGILQSYTTAAEAVALSKRTDAERGKYLLANAGKIFPQLAEQAEVTASTCWDNEPWQRGAYAWFRPGEMLNWRTHLAEPEGRIHFAGEHTSTLQLHASQQGALESGMRVAKEIAAAP